MHNHKLRLIFTYLLSAMFILSSLSKLFPISAFELQIVSTKITDWSFAPYIARIVILSELAIGINLLLWINGRKILYILSALFLAGFSIYLSVIMFLFGNQANCGCFGQILPMSSAAALIKNLMLLIPILVFLWSWEKNTYSFRKPLILTLVISVFLFMIFPVPKITASIPISPSVIEPVTMALVDSSEARTKVKDSAAVKLPAPPRYTLLKKSRSIFHEFTKFSNTIIVPDTGIKIFALFSLDCEHCLAAAKQIAILKKKVTLPPVYGLLLGEESQVAQFSNESGLRFPYAILPPEKFFPLLTQSPPRIVLLGNGNTLYDADASTFSVDSLKHKLRIFQ